MKACECFTVRKPTRKERQEDAHARELFKVWTQQNLFHQRWCRVSL